MPNGNCSEASPVAGARQDAARRAVLFCCRNATTCDNLKPCFWPLASPVGWLGPVPDGRPYFIMKLVQRCLAPERQDRPADAGAVAQAVAAYQKVVRERLRQLEAARGQALVRVQEERKRRRVTMVLAGAVLLVLLAGIVTKPPSGVPSATAKSRSVVLFCCREGSNLR
jgi:hypothetical protein